MAFVTSGIALMLWLRMPARGFVTQLVYSEAIALCSWLLIDVGTNAELILGNRKRLVCTSTPTGPALEGAHVEYGMRAAPGAIERVHIDEKTLEPRYKIVGEEEWNTGKAKGICGSAIIDAVAELFRAGIVDSRGKFKKGLATKRVREGESGWEYVVAWAEETSIGRDIPMTQQDVRQIQLAKAALFVAATAAALFAAVRPSAASSIVVVHPSVAEPALVPAV